MKRIKKQKGFTLIETLVAVFIFSIIVVAIGTFQKDVFSLNYILQTGLKNQNEAKKILRPFANEARSASQSNLGAFPLATVATTTFAFYSDIDNDGLKEKVRYFLEGTTFKKGVVKPTGNPLVYNDNNESIVRVVHDVVNVSIFSYYDESYDGTASSTPLVQPVTPSDVRLVQVEIVIDSDPNKPPAPLSVTTQVSIRNLKDNL